MRPVVVDGEEPARALDTALPMLAVAGLEKSVLEGFISAVSVKSIVRIKSSQRVVECLLMLAVRWWRKFSQLSSLFIAFTRRLYDVRRTCIINVLSARVWWLGSEVFHE